jgi:hypothetical protein
MRERERAREREKERDRDRFCPEIISVIRQKGH